MYYNRATRIFKGTRSHNGNRLRHKGECAIVCCSFVALFCCIGTLYFASQFLQIKLDASALLNAPNMTELLLNNNLIDDVPLEVGALLKLKLIDVGCNNLQSMPTGLGYLPDLTRIVYAGNPCEVCVCVAVVVEIEGPIGKIFVVAQEKGSKRLFSSAHNIFFIFNLLFLCHLISFKLPHSMCFCMYEMQLLFWAQVRLGTRSSEDLKRFMRTRGPPHPALKEAGIEVEDESDASGKLMAKAKKLLASGAATVLEKAFMCGRVCL